MEFSKKSVKNGTSTRNAQKEVGANELFLPTVKLRNLGGALAIRKHRGRAAS